jgi:hypothetical protein
MEYSYRIAIPSYKRAETLRLKTLHTLAIFGFPPEIIDVFVIPEEKERYSHILWEDFYGNLIEGVPTLAGQRVFIQSYYPVGQKILMLDDDITNFKTIVNFPLPRQFEWLFEKLQQEDCNLFGIYPASNLFFMKDKLQKGLHYCIGSCFGIINKRDLAAPMDEKEDYYMTLQRYQTDGAILRYCGISPVTTYWKGVGGMNATRTDESELNGANLMKQLFPELVKCVYRKKGGRWDLKLVRQVSQLLPESSLFEELTNLSELDHLHLASPTSHSSQT